MCSSKWHSFSAFGECECGQFCLMLLAPGSMVCPPRKSDQPIWRRSSFGVVNCRVACCARSKSPADHTGSSLRGRTGGGLQHSEDQFPMKLFLSGLSQQPVDGFQVLTQFGFLISWVICQPSTNAWRRSGVHMRLPSIRRQDRKCASDPQKVDILYGVCKCCFLAPVNQNSFLVHLCDGSALVSASCISTCDH